MRIHTDTLTITELAAARNYAADVSGAPVYFLDTVTEHGSRSRAYALTVYLQSDGSLSRHRTQRDRDAYAATYAQWGHFLAHLFTADPRAVAGPYKGAADFHRQTADQFRSPANV